MISADDLLAHALEMLVRAQPTPDEALLRRVISTSYYGLFHLLTEAGSGLFSPGGQALAAQASRAYTHASMWRVCEAYLRSPKPAMLQAVVLTPVDPRLLRVAEAFVQLQGEREDADYNLSTTFTYRDASRLVVLSWAARDDFRAIQQSPETTTFLTALLLADRWARRG